MGCRSGLIGTAHRFSLTEIPFDSTVSKYIEEARCLESSSVSIPESISDSTNLAATDLYLFKDLHMESYEEALKRSVS